MAVFSLIKMRFYLNFFTVAGLAFVLFIAPFTTHAYCGDGLLEEVQGEQCDDGNFSPGDGCNSYCELEDVSPPEVLSVSVEEEEKGIPTSLRNVTVVFSEPIDDLSVSHHTVSVEHHAEPLDVDFKIDTSGHTLTIIFKQTLFSEASHAIRIKGVRDLAGNVLTGEFIRVFETAKHIDKKPPTIEANPKGGAYNYAQAVELTAYIDNLHKDANYIDEGATIYYTLDGSVPTTDSLKYKEPIRIKKHTTLRYFGVDASGNRGFSKTQVYTFGCPDRPNSQRVSPYPLCRVLECQKGFVLRNNSCVADIKSGKGKLEENAVTAPLFYSNSPLTIGSKPALHITAQHHGIIRRPIVFKNIKRGTEVHFDRGTTITDETGKAFSGYLTPPINRYTKEFPINFGYSIKSILEFIPTDGRKLNFDLAYRIVVPMDERFEADEEALVFTFDPKAELYRPYPQDRVTTDLKKKQVVISATETNLFFVAQAGEHFSRSEFKDMENHWAKNYAEILHRRGIVKGRSKGVYAPNEVLNRAEFTKIAIEAMGAEIASEDELEDSYFPDVPLYAWYTPYVNKAYELGLIKGYSDGTFKPEKPINRAEAVKILIAAFQFDLDAANAHRSEYDFDDIRVDQWYYRAVNFALKNNLLAGERDAAGKLLSRFSPGKAMTRGEMAQLAAKTIEFSENNED